MAFPLWTLLGSDGGLGGSNPDSTSSSDGSFGFWIQDIKQNNHACVTCTCTYKVNNNTQM